MADPRHVRVVAARADMPCTTPPTPREGVPRVPPTKRPMYGLWIGVNRTSLSDRKEMLCQCQIDFSARSLGRKSRTSYEWAPDDVSRSPQPGASPHDGLSHCVVLRASHQDLPAFEDVTPEDQFSKFAQKKKKKNGWHRPRTGNGLAAGHELGCSRPLRDQRRDGVDQPTKSTVSRDAHGRGVLL